MEDLQIEMMDNDFHNWVQENGMRAALQLANRMSKIKTPRFFSKEMAIQDRVPIQYFDDDDEAGEGSRITQLHKILNAFIGGRKLYTTAVYSERDPSFVNIRIRDNQLLKFQYDVDPTDYRLEDLETPIYQLPVPLPDKKISITGPEIIHEFEFKVHMLAYRENTLPKQ